MQVWEPEITRTTIGEIQLYCVEDEVWQEFRKSLKGISTQKKLDKCREWLDRWETGLGPLRRAEVQVDNYLNALLRGGQLVRRVGKVMTKEYWLANRNELKPNWQKESLNTILNAGATNN